MEEPTPKRKPKTFTLDADAIEYLKTLVPSDKSHGRVISELIRNEIVRREERQRVRQELAAQLLSEACHV